MQVSTIHKAKTHLSNLIKKVESGEDVIICKAGRPIVRLVKYQKILTPRKAGICKGKVKMSDDFDELPTELLSKFYDKI
jgi:prevent-host-death family protein